MSRSRTERVRYAVVGLGHLAQVAVLPAFARSKNSKLAALVSGDPRKGSQLGRRYGIDDVYSYERYEECLTSGIDAVYIVLPNHLHAEFSIKASELGVHVLCEKPMAVTARECRDMILAARRSDTRLMIAYRLHFERANLESIDVVSRGKLGDPRFFTSEFSQQVAADNVRLTTASRNGGGPIYDMGVYCINAARYLFRDEPTTVCAMSASGDGKRFRHAEEMTSVLMTFPDDRLASFTASFGAADFGRYMIVGTKGTLSADPAFGYSEGHKVEITINGKKERRSYPRRDEFAAEITYFSDCILRNRDPEPSGEEGLADVRIIEAIYESVRRGKAVRLPKRSSQGTGRLDETNRWKVGSGPKQRTSPTSMVVARR